MSLFNIELHKYIIEHHFKDEDRRAITMKSQNKAYLKTPQAIELHGGLHLSLAD